MADEVVRGEQTSIKAHTETHEVGVKAVEQDVLMTGKPSLDHGEKKEAVSISEHPCGDNWKKSGPPTSSGTYSPEGLETHKKLIESEKYPPSIMKKCLKHSPVNEKTPKRSALWRLGMFVLFSAATSQNVTISDCLFGLSNVKFHTAKVINPFSSGN